MSEINEKEKKEEQNKGEEENNEEDEEEKELIKYSYNYGGITQESVFWDDYEEMGEENLLKHKIIKVKIYTGTYSEKKVIFGFGCISKIYLKEKLKKKKFIKEQNNLKMLKNMILKGKNIWLIFILDSIMMLNILLN